MDLFIPATPALSPGGREWGGHPMTGPLIKAASRSFSRHPVLRQELMAKFPAARFNDAGVTFDEASFNDFIQGADGVVVGLEAVTETVLAANPGLQNRRQIWRWTR